MALNLAKRPFVDTRPVNALTAFLVVLVLGLSVVSWRTFGAYLEGSRGTQAAITRLRSEISRFEDRRKAGEAALARFDVDELGMAAEDANDIARRRSFSWTRFLSRLEETLPHEVRVVSIALSRVEKEAKTGKPATGLATPAEGIPVDLLLVSRDPLGLPKAIRRFYASPYFDVPAPHTDEGQERGGPEGRRISLSVLYKDAGRPGAPPLPPYVPSVAKPASGKPAGAARPAGAAKPRGGTR